jgi:hypothetical protein
MSLILPSAVDGLTETDVANFLITAVVTAGGRLYTALTVAGLFLGDEMIRASPLPVLLALRHEGALKGSATRAARKSAQS